MSKGAYIGINNVAHKIKKGFIGGSSGGDSGGSVFGIMGEDSPDGSYYILVRQGEGTKLTVTRTYVDNSIYFDQGDYIGELVNGELFEDEYGIWRKYAAWNDDYFTIEAEALPGYTIDTYVIDDAFYNYHVSGMEYNQGYDGNYAWNFDPNDFGEVARIYTTATKNDSGDNGSSAKKGAYIGIDNVARKINKIYIGIDGVARKIKKAYIGIGGVARPCWSNRELVYYGTVTDLSVARCKLAATHVGDYALFGGGGDDSRRRYSTVDAYNKSLTRTTVTELSAARYNLAATHVGDYALFGGGGDDGGNVYSTVDAYNKSLTRTTPTELDDTRYNLTATHVGDYALFGGGLGRAKNLIVYNKSLTRTIQTELSNYIYDLAATHVGDYALFGGGCYSSVVYPYSNVDAYNKSLTRTTPTELSVGRYDLAATHVGDYALFGGGLYNEGTSNSHDVEYPTVDAYNKLLTRTIPTELSVARCDLAATHVGDYALFGGGRRIGGAYYDYTYAYSNVDAYNKSLTRTTATELSVGRFKLTATHVGDYALFGGGCYSSNAYSTVDAYIVT